MTSALKKLRCFIFSDIHKNARSSRFEEVEARLHEEIAKSDIVVLNGDIIEMFYPRHLVLLKLPIEAYIEAAKEGADWIESLLKLYPDKKFMYLEGNHENCDLFRAHIYKLRDENSNLIWGRTHMSIGDGNFFHGDNEVRNTDVEKRERGQLKDIVSGRLHEGLNITAERAAMWAMRIINGDGKIVDRMYNFIQKVNPERLEKAKHMFFGHTHLPFLNFFRHGKFWHNTGSASMFGKDNFLTFDLVVPEGCEYETTDKRVFYPEAQIANVRHVDMGGKYSDLAAQERAVVTRMIR